MMKASIATGVFTLAGIASAYFLAAPALLLPHGIVYALLMLNTFFSVRFFSEIIPTSVRQGVIDAVLVVLYLALALSLGYSLLFPLIGALLFFAASGKYAMEIGSTRYPEILRRKIYVDIAGFAAFLIAFTVTLLGFAHIAAWALAIAFAIANVYLLYVNPLYTK